MACTQQHRLQVLAVDVGAIGQILQQAYVSNTETCGCFICLGSRSWKFLTCSSMLFLSVRSWMRIFLIHVYARRNCICGFVCSYNRKKEPGGTLEVRGSSLLCLIFSVSFVASFIMLVHDTEKKNGSRATSLSLSLSFFSFSTAASAFFNRPSACSHSLALSRSRAGASSSFLSSAPPAVG